MNLITISAIISILAVAIVFSVIGKKDIENKRLPEATLFLIVNLLYFTNLFNPAILFILSSVSMIIFIIPEYREILEDTYTVLSKMIYTLIILVFSVVPVYNIITFLV